MVATEIISITSGAVAGLVTDSILYPIDTIKTRIQSTRTILKSNLYKNLFSGIPTVIAASAPNAAVFFLSYEFIKKLNNQSTCPVITSLAATGGEISACLIRCPFEVIKQRSQDQPKLKLYQVTMNTISENGILRGLYRGYFTMVFREIPFSIIQFPIWEHLKKNLKERQNNEPLKSWQSAICGFFAGGTAAVLTTPLDVAKTRIMIAEKGSFYYSGSLIKSLGIIFQESGIRGLFFGVGPRFIQISCGGAIFLGVYDFVRNSMMA
uniref:Slc25a-6 n=1 Tax=Schmidtea mediterranea TaxID=79327 RepID=A0A0H3YJB7_SCHMD|nr:slc25a-6 [Schmidtea mediterranea]